MKCPLCKTVDLLTISIQGIEIDCCPDCNGVWLDKGELDVIIDKPEIRISAVLQNHLYKNAGKKMQSYERKTYEGREYGENGCYMKKTQI